MQRSFLFVPLAFGIALTTGTALAQTAAPDEAHLEEARNEYRVGVQAFQRGRFAEATVAFERSYRARPHPATLYNAAEARMRSGDNEGALGQLRDLLAMTSPAPDADLAARARNLALQMGEHDLQPAAPRVVAQACPVCPTCQQEAPVCPPPPPPDVVTRNITPGAWALGGAAVALTALGAGFLGVAVDNASTYTNPLTPAALQQQLSDQGSTYRTVGIVGLVLGVGATIGAAWMFTHPQERRSPSMARVDVGVSSNGVAFSGRF